MGSGEIGLLIRGVSPGFGGAGSVRGWGRSLRSLPPSPRRRVGTPGPPKADAPQGQGRSGATPGSSRTHSRNSAAGSSDYLSLLSFVCSVGGRVVRRDHRTIGRSSRGPMLSRSRVAAFGRGYPVMPVLRAAHLSPRLDGTDRRFFADATLGWRGSFRNRVPARPNGARAGRWLPRWSWGF